MRHYPTKDFSGLVIVLSQPSRQDITQLLSGWAGEFFFRYAVSKEHTRQSVDIRTSDTLNEGLLPDTKGILLFGERAMKEWTTPKTYDKYFLGEQRGCPLDHQFTPHTIPMIATYAPQDAMDVLDYEHRFNPHLHESDINEDPDIEGQVEKQRHGATKRSNFRFWLLQDTRKMCVRIQDKDTNKATVRHFAISDFQTCEFRIYANSLEIQTVLEKVTVDDLLYLDIETDSELNITCFGFAVNDGPLYVVPCLRYNYELAYTLDDLAKIYRNLAIATSRATTVCQNGMFDLFVLVWKYKLPIGSKLWDSMLSHHRCFPEAEKSLGHAMSLWTWQAYHKADGVFAPKCRQQENQLWEYNANDVHGMRLVKRAIDRYSQDKPGLQASIAQANSMVRPYLISTLFGIRYDADKVKQQLKENDAWMTQYLRIIEVLIGHEVLPTSNKQCAAYFVDEMGYDIVSRTGKGKAAFDAEALFKLKLKYPDNPIIDLMLMFRTKSKETGTLKFTPWMT